MIEMITIMTIITACVVAFIMRDNNQLRQRTRVKITRNKIKGRK